MAWKKLYIQPNKAAQKAAKRGLEARRKAPKSKKGGLDAVQASMAGVGSGVLRARDIVAGKRVNAYQVNAFFNRHRNNYVNASIEGLKPVESRAIQAWLLWGGEPLRKQAAAAVRKDKAKRNPVENTSRDPARMSDEDLQVELDSAADRVEKAVHQTEWEQEPEYVLGYAPLGTVIYKSSPDERFPETLEGPPHDYTPEQYRERLRRDYDIFQEILRRPHLSVVEIESERFLRGKSSGDEDLERYVNNWRDEQVGFAWYERDRGNKELQARQEASAIMEGRSSKQIRYNEYLKERFAQLPHVRYDAFDDSSRSNPIARSVAKRNRRAMRNPIDTRDLTDDEIEDQAAAISRLLGETARNSEDHPHEVDLPQTRRAWKMYKSLEKEKESRIAKRNRKAKRNPTGRAFKFDELSESQKSLLIDEDFKYQRYRVKGDLDDQAVRFDIAKRALRFFERLIEHYATWGHPLGWMPFSESPLYSFYESGVIRGSWETRFDLPIQGYERIEEVDALLSRVADQVGTGGAPLSDRVTEGGREYEEDEIGEKSAYVSVSAIPSLVQALEILHDLRDYTWDTGKYEGDEFRGHRRRGEKLGDPPELPPARTYGRFEENPIARSVAKRNRKAERNPDHIIDISERRRKAEAERMLGLFSPEDLDPVEESTSAIMDSVEDYCRLRGNPRRYNPSIERGGKISYGEYYGLPDGDGGYDLYYKDAIIASGVDTVEQAEEEISQHLESL